MVSRINVKSQRCTNPILQLMRLCVFACVEDGLRLKKMVRIRTPTPPKFNIDPEKWWLEDYFPIGKVTFQGLC